MGLCLYITNEWWNCWFGIKNVEIKVKTWFLHESFLRWRKSWLWVNDFCPSHVVHRQRMIRPKEMAMTQKALTEHLIASHCGKFSLNFWNRGSVKGDRIKLYEMENSIPVQILSHQLSHLETVPHIHLAMVQSHPVTLCIN